MLDIKARAIRSPFQQAAFPLAFFLSSLLTSASILMARFAQLAVLLPLFFSLFDLARSSPIIDEDMRRSLEGRDGELRPLHLARRDASGNKPRHLRPEEILLSKRDSITAPDVGQLPNFDGDPQPIRNGAGASFLGPSNHVLDKQNLDNVAGPTSDAGMLWFSPPFHG